MAETDMGIQEAGAMGLWHRYRLLIIVAAIGVAIIGWLAVSKGVAVRHAEEAAATERAELIKQAEARQTETLKQSLAMFGVPLAWALRREMMADNLDQVDQYVTDLVKQKGFERVVVAKADGSVAVASDRKQLGTAFSSLYPERYLTAEQISVEETAPGKWLVIVPIMGLNARLGTAAIDYQAQPSTLGNQ
jgi:hypothetical protein